MGNVIESGIERTFPPSINAREIWAEDEPPAEMVWEVCRYTSMRGACRHCPRVEHDEDLGEVQRGCYGLAAEVCRIVSAMSE